MSTCDTCPLREWCYERRGICKSYIDYAERVERTKKDIERINQSKSNETSEAEVAADKASGHRLRQNELYPQYPDGERAAEGRTR